MWKRWAAAAAALGLLAAGCSGKRDAIILNDTIITVENQTSREWQNVVVTVNDHFRGGARTLAAGQLLTAPLSQFQTAYGQRFAIGRQAVFRIDVAATDASGQAVAIEWSGNRRHETTSSPEKR